MVSKPLKHAQLQQLQQFLTTSRIPFAFPSFSEYKLLRQQYIQDTPANPLAIACPRSVEDVSLLVSYAVAAKIAITVRSGGNDLYGRCFAENALAIDMRDISHVEVSADKLSARIGGGILTGRLAEQLAKQNLATAFGSVPSVGYIGWATHGGYGPFVGSFGMGVDQIIGATIINCEGKIVKADESMLQAIRGGGGTVGVIGEMTVKVYALDKILGGMLLFDSRDLASTIRNFMAGYAELLEKGLSGALGIQQNVLNTPMGKVFGVGFMWSSPNLEEGYQALDKIIALGHVLHKSVTQTTIPEWMDGFARFTPKVAYGRNCTINLRKLSEEVSSVIGEHVVKMPKDPSTLLSILQLRGPSEAQNTGSVFAAREAHYCLEFIATSSDPEQTKAAWEWAVAFREALRKTDERNILDSTYISLTPPGETNLSAIYGENSQKLAKIKRKYDKENVFRYALPQFS